MNFCAECFAQLLSPRKPACPPSAKSDCNTHVESGVTPARTATHLSAARKCRRCEPRSSPKPHYEKSYAKNSHRKHARSSPSWTQALPVRGPSISFPSASEFDPPNESATALRYPTSLKSSALPYRVEHLSSQPLMIGTLQPRVGSKQSLRRPLAPPQAHFDRAASRQFAAAAIHVAAC